MNYDPLYIQKLTKLVNEVLKDEARYYRRANTDFAELHDQFFNKVKENNFASLPEETRKKFRKYFYEGSDLTTPRQDVPFTGSEEQQAFFFDSLRMQVRHCTFGLDEMRFLIPSFSDEKATEPSFSNAQSELLRRGLVFPIMQGLEQREISLIEKKKTGGEQLAEREPANANPYQSAGDKILVQSESGEFDSILTYDQLLILAGFKGDLEKIKEYLRANGLNIKLDENGNVFTYLGSLGISAYDIPGNGPAGQDIQSNASFSFSQLLGEMKARQGRANQYKSLIAGKGTLSLSQNNFTYTDAAGAEVPLNGLSLKIDQGGNGSNVVFVLTDNGDREGRNSTSTLVELNVDDDRAGQNPQEKLTFYENPQEKSPTGPTMAIAPADPRLQIPLRQLYEQVSQPPQYETFPAAPTPHPRGEGGVPEMPLGVAPTAGAIPVPMTLRLNLGRPEITVKQPPATATEEPGVRRTVTTRRPTPTYTVAPRTSATAYGRSSRPKILANAPAQRPSPRPGQPAGPATGPARGGKVTAEDQTAQTTPPAPGKKTNPLIALIPGATVLGGSAVAALLQVLMMPPK